MVRQKVKFPAEQVAAVAAFLREPRSRTRRLLAANHKWLAELEHRRNNRLEKPEMRRHTARLRFAQQGNLLQLLRDDARSRLLVTYHFGDYIYGLNLLAASIGARARVHYMAHARGSAAYFANMKLAFGEHALGPRSQLLAREASIGKLAPLLRRRGAQFITFCDLGEQFGAGVQVDFLFRGAWFSRGPALLGLTNRVPLLPVINWYDGGREQLVLGAQLEPERFDGETLAAAAGRITAELVRFFEPFFRSNPEQWRYLAALPLYFIRPGSAGAFQSKEETHASTRQDFAITDPLRRCGGPGDDQSRQPDRGIGTRFPGHVRDRL